MRMTFNKGVKKPKEGRAKLDHAETITFFLSPGKTKIFLINQASLYNYADDNTLACFSRSLPKLVEVLEEEAGNALIVPFHKKGSRQCKNNYRPISLLPILGKTFEKVLFDKIYSHLIWISSGRFKN